jgi:hypothetical protein
MISETVVSDKRHTKKNEKKEIKRKMDKKV